MSTKWQLFMRAFVYRSSVGADYEKTQAYINSCRYVTGLLYPEHDGLTFGNSLPVDVAKHTRRLRPWYLSPNLKRTATVGPASSALFRSLNNFVTNSLSDIHTWQWSDLTGMFRRVSLCHRHSQSGIKCNLGTPMVTQWQALKSACQ
jgi:hypothetical protein